MSELGQLERYLPQDDAHALWQQRYSERSQAQAEAGMPDPAHVTYIGVMSESYSPNRDHSYIPVESGAELFSMVPKDYGYIGSQIAANHVSIGKVAVPFQWSAHHTSISGLAYGMIRVLTAFLLTQLEDGVLPPSLPTSEGSTDAALVRNDLSPEVWAKPIDLYELLCKLFGEIHGAYYGEYPGKYTDRIPQILRRNELVAVALGESLTQQGKDVLGILLDLGGQWDRDWVTGFRELGSQVMLHEKGIFAGDVMLLWFLAIQQEFEFAARREVASYVWMQEREKQRAKDDD